ncbi:MULTISPECIES: hypothetical protein [Lactobacillus]|uniref:Uncharacterized protein n=1 Tax=Lactobacillus xujianguonis TaxID=2495899 RepID=A0A437STF5_9LACO|nr:MULTISPECIES: hypothetical protein [Lactobacillus]RVU70210.1 hypothetical protein EJK17_08710 [Lactobacillus xujianguonis]RVU73392.1 hypothetical protein EJK20_08580 [Lactobacillus xujianguonis]
MNSEDLFKLRLEMMAQKQAKQAVAYQDLFTPQFMQTNTKFANFNFFMKALKVKDFEALTSLPSTKLDSFVKAETEFNNWEQMQAAAVNGYMTKILNQQ